MKQYGIIILSSLLSAILAVFIYRQFEKPQQPIVSEEQPAQYTAYKDEIINSIRPRTFLSSSPTNFTAAAEAVTPTVVNIKISQGNDRFDFWGMGSIGTSTGSGVIISQDGYIVTNNHVIENSSEIEVTLNNRNSYRAKLIGTDPSTDLALLKIKAKNLPHLEFGNSDSLRIGEWVLAVGNPFNLESTVTAGIVSAKGRNIDILEGQDRIESFIQTDAAVNPGNSGGALVNTNGELIGINTAIITRSGRYEGYSFAVPANLVRKVINDLRDFGVVQRGILGVFIAEVTNERAKKLQLPSVEGIYITRVTPNSGAEEAGLRKGDVIVGINNIKTRTMPEMQEQLGRLRPGNKVKVKYYRKGKMQSTTVVLKNKSNNTELITATEERSLKDLGFEVRDLNKQEIRELQTEGAKVVSIFRGSKIERTNMDPGFIITAVDDKPIKNVQDLISALENADDRVMLEGVYENYPGEYYYAFKK